MHLSLKDREWSFRWYQEVLEIIEVIANHKSETIWNTKMQNILRCCTSQPESTCADGKSKCQKPPTSSCNLNNYTHISKFGKTTWFYQTYPDLILFFTSKKTCEKPWSFWIFLARQHIQSLRLAHGVQQLLLLKHSQSKILIQVV